MANQYLSNQIPAKKRDKKAAAYLRVSTSRQKEEGYSIDFQLEKAHDYADKNGWKLEKPLVFEEQKPATKIEGQHISEENLIGSFRERPALTELLIRAQKKEFSHLIIYSRDRLSRVVEDSIALESYFKSLNINIHYTKAGENIEDTESEMGRLLHLVFTSMAEMEGNILSSRAKTGGEACVKQGRWAGGKIPLGYVPVYHKNGVEDRKKWHTTLEKSEFESGLIEEVFTLYLRGMGYVKIANIMNEKYGFIHWSKGKIEAIIKNRTYTGRITWNRRGGRRRANNRNRNPIISAIEHENSIVNEDVWNEIVKERNNRNSSKDGAYYNTRFILKDKIVCAKCNNPMKSKNQGKNKADIYYCTSSIKVKKEHGCVNIPARLIEDIFIDYMKSQIFNMKSTEVFYNDYKERFDKIHLKYSKMNEEAKKRINECEEYLRKIEEKTVDEKDEYLLEALNTQSIIYRQLRDQYEQAIAYVEEKSRISRKNKEELNEIMKNFIPGLFLTEKNETIVRIRREFIICFVDKIVAAYDKENKIAKINKIEFLTPDFI